MDRRNFFLTLLAPLAARLWPAPAPALLPASPALDELNAVTLESISQFALEDNFFVTSPLLYRLIKG